MGLKQCDKCSEMVDEAKAFCPACGNAFVEEEHRSISTNFEAMDSTVQLGQTMYNQMLSDMGLNISKSPDAPEKRVEVLTPAPVPVAPAAPAAAASPQPRAESPVQKQASSGTLKWILIGGAVLIILGLIVLIAAVAVYWYWLRTL